MVSSPYNFKGSVATLANLPSSGNVINDTYYVEAVKYRVTWTGSAWAQSSMDEADYEDELASVNSDVSKINRALSVYNCYDYVSGMDNRTETMAGVTFTWDGKSSYTVTGTATAISYIRLFYNRSALPYGMVAGGTYILRYKAEKVRLEIFWYNAGGTQTTLLGTYEDTVFTLPSAAVGALIRLRVYNGDTVNETVTPVILSALSNSDITKYLSEYNTYPILDQLSKTSAEDDGITYTYDKTTDSYSVVGTATGLTYYNLFGSKTVLPSGVSAGDTIFLDVYSTDSNITLEVFLYNADGNGKGNFSVYTPTALALPAGTVGIILRIRVANGSTVNGQFKLKILTGLAAKRLGSSELFTTNYGVGAPFFADCNDVKTNSIMFISKDGGTTSQANFPFNGAGWLQTINIPGNSIAVFQIAYPYDTARHVWYRSCQAGTWQPWVEIGSGGGGSEVTYEITQNITRDTYNNSYTIETTPTITTDTNGWLAAVDDDSTTQENATDMTGAIMSMLTATGYCHLGPGKFWVSGGIDMPSNSTLCGCGKDTVVQLLDSVSTGYVVQPTYCCTIKDIKFKGGDSAPADISTDGATDLGARHGVYCVGNYDGNTSHATVTSYYNVIENCYFESFDGSAIYMANTGISSRGYLQATDITINSCMVGIHIDWYSEYNKFVNFIARRCNHACINNGGNNVFVGCTFQGIVGFVMDNSGSDKGNNSHGTCSACTFNHINSNNGNGVVIKNNNNGFIFDSCQMWYSGIVVEESRGMHFSNCLIGGGSPRISIAGAYPAFFSNCIFHATPSITDSSNSKFDNCYLDSTGAVIKP